MTDTNIYGDFQIFRQEKPIHYEIRFPKWKKVPKWDSHIETIPKMKKQGKRQGAYAWLGAAPGEITL